VLAAVQEQVAIQCLTTKAPYKVRAWYQGDLHSSLTVTRERHMRERWKQAGLILLSALSVWFAFVASFVLLSSYPQYLMMYPPEFEGQLDVAIVCLAIYPAAVKWIERRVPTELSLWHALPGLAPGAGRHCTAFTRHGDSLACRRLSA
jgi:hypothetical protein